MAKRATKVRRDGKPQFTEAQLRAFRARQEATAAANAQRAATEAEAIEEGELTPENNDAVALAYWSRAEEEYSSIYTDLVRFAMISAILLFVILVLWVFFG